MLTNAQTDTLFSMIKAYAAVGRAERTMAERAATMAEAGWTADLIMANRDTVDLTIAETLLNKADLALWNKGKAELLAQRIGDAKTPYGNLLNRIGNARSRIVKALKAVEGAADDATDDATEGDAKPKGAAAAATRGRNKPLPDSLKEGVDAMIKRIKADKAKESPALMGHDELIAQFVRIKDLIK
jgi:hypothetical protein